MLLTNVDAETLKRAFLWCEGMPRAPPEAAVLESKRALATVTPWSAQSRVKEVDDPGVELTTVVRAITTSGRDARVSSTRPPAPKLVVV